MRKLLVAATFATATVLGAGAALFVGAATPAASASLLSPGPTSIPVLDWHELDNGCASTDPVCNAPDPESVSTAQLTAELSYLKSQGYQTITPAQYEAWVEGKGTGLNLPAKPIFLVADNGIENFLAGAQSILASDGYTMAVGAITGFADGASGVCPEPTYEPGCPVANQDWDATWAQLKALSPSVYSFIIEAGTAGHFVQDYDPDCTAFYACMVPGETAAQYENRVESDLSAGQSEIVQQLGEGRFTKGMWVVPYSDDGYTACRGVSCTPQPYDGPAGWLTNWTASNYQVAFVEDAPRNGTDNERYRIDVQGWMTQSEFESTLNGDLAAGYFTRTHTAEPTPSDVVTDNHVGTPASDTSVTFTDTLSGSSPLGAPTGSVSWSVGGTAGLTACTSSTSALAANGQATCTVTVGGTPGTLVVSAAYGGDENYATTTSNADSVTVG